ncbi:hypothetical protein FKW77_006402 [Venturia effusa]|uniref:Uncharacterized protein n=1 Tax=Venturia effusa TaxID=50376 RepID=A0A517KZL5_9PEZI|nr:hypothetical protein FKW77_006402 [Venturia effusa]
MRLLLGLFLISAVVFSSPVAEPDTPRPQGAMPNDEAPGGSSGGQWQGSVQRPKGWPDQPQGNSWNNVPGGQNNNGWVPPPQPNMPQAAPRGPESRPPPPTPRFNPPPYDPPPYNSPSNNPPPYNPPPKILHLTL